MYRWGNPQYPLVELLQSRLKVFHLLNEMNENRIFLMNRKNLLFSLIWILHKPHQMSIFDACSHNSYVIFIFLLNFCILCLFISATIKWGYISFVKMLVTCKRLFKKSYKVHTSLIKDKF